MYETNATGCTWRGRRKGSRYNRSHAQLSRRTWNPVRTLPATVTVAVGVLLAPGCRSPDTEWDFPGHDAMPSMSVTLDTLHVIRGDPDPARRWELSKPRAVLEGMEGNVYVLDSDWMRVGVHTPEGTLSHLVGDGYGSKDGHMLMPVDMDWQGDDLVVLDFSREEILRFARDGTYRGAVPVTDYSSRNIAGTSTGIWTRMLIPHGGQWLVGYEGAENAIFLGDLDNTDKALADIGFGGGIATSRSGDILWHIHGTGALLTSYDMRGGHEGTRVLDRVVLGPLPKVLPVADGAYLPSWMAYDISELSTGELVILRARIVNYTPELTYEQQDTLYEMAVYTTDGELLAVTSLGSSDVPLSVSSSPADQAVWLAYIGDDPRAVKYRLNLARREVPS